MMDTLSVADAMALKNDNNGMNGFGDGAWWIIVLFLFLFGNGNNGFGGNGATAATQNEILLGQKFQDLTAKMNAIGDGICDSTFALNNSITSEGRALQTQLAQCCCDTRVGIQALGAQINDQSCAITTAIHAEGEATRAMIKDNEIQSLRDKVSDLQLRASQCDQNAYLVNQLRPCPIPAFNVPSPYCCYTPCGCNGTGYQPSI